MLISCRAVELSRSTSSASTMDTRPDAPVAESLSKVWQRRQQERRRWRMLKVSSHRQRRMPRETNLSRRHRCYIPQISSRTLATIRCSCRVQQYYLAMLAALKVAIARVAASSRLSLSKTASSPISASIQTCCLVPLAGRSWITTTASLIPILDLRPAS